MSVLAIGTFDGVHLGHRAVIQAARVAAGTGDRVTGVTFWPHPSVLLNPSGAAPLLQDLDAREDALLEAGVDEILLLEFTPQLAALSPAVFVERYLAPLHPTAVAVGANFTFGAGGAGTPGRLAELADWRFRVLASPIVEVDGEVVSSSTIRRLVMDGEVASAARLLGRDFSVRQVVVHGDHRGRGMGFPTANLLPGDGLVVPADGVYAGWLRVVDESTERLPAAISVGSNPTFGSSRRVEAHVLGVDIDLYGRTVEVGFRQMLRGMVTFASVDDLVAQMRLDVAETARIMARR